MSLVVLSQLLKGWHSGGGGGFRLYAFSKKSKNSVERKKEEDCRGIRQKE